MLFGACREALVHGLERLDELPLSPRLMREMHECLFQGGCGGTKYPGEFRRSQNWIGGVPQLVGEFEVGLDQFERFIHEDASRLPPLARVARQNRHLAR